MIILDKRSKETAKAIKKDILNNKIKISNLYKCFNVISNRSFYYNHAKREYNILDDLLNNKISVHYYPSVTYGTAPNTTIKTLIGARQKQKYNYFNIFDYIIQDKEIQAKLKEYVYSFVYSNLSSKQQELLNY